MRLSSMYLRGMPTDGRHATVHGPVVAQGAEAGPLSVYESKTFVYAEIQKIEKHVGRDEITSLVSDRIKIRTQ